MSTCCRFCWRWGTSANAVSSWNRRDSCSLRYKCSSDIDDVVNRSCGSGIACLHRVPAIDAATRGITPLGSYQVGWRCLLPIAAALTPQAIFITWTRYSVRSRGVQKRRQGWQARRLRLRSRLSRAGRTRDMWRRWPTPQPVNETMRELLGSKVGLCQGSEQNTRLRH